MDKIIHICKYCNKCYASYTSLVKHNNKFHKN